MNCYVYVLWDFIFFFEYGTQNFFSIVTNSMSRMHAHTGIKYFHKIHHPPKKWGEAGCILACARRGLEQSQFFAGFVTSSAAIRACSVLDGSSFVRKFA